MPGYVCRVYLDATVINLHQETGDALRLVVAARIGALDYYLARVQKRLIAVDAHRDVEGLVDIKQGAVVWDDRLVCVWHLGNRKENVDNDGDDS